MTREEAKYFDNDSCGYDGVSFYAVNERIDQIFDEHEAQLKAKDEEIDRIKEIINTSIEEIEYVIIKPHYVEVYLNNAIRFLKDNK